MNLRISQPHYESLRDYPFLSSNMGALKRIAHKQKLNCLGIRKLDEPNALAIIWCVAQKASNTGCVALKDIIVVSVLLDRKQDTFCSGFRMSWAVS